MKYMIDTNNKPFAFEDNVTQEIITKVEGTHNTKLTEITEAEYKAIITPSDEEVFTQTKTSKATEITQAFNQAVGEITTALPHEMVSWRKQENEARAYTADNSVATPFIDAQVATRQLETKDELVAKIIANAYAYQVAYAGLLGKYQNLMSKVNAATTVDELEALSW